MFRLQKAIGHSFPTKTLMQKLYLHISTRKQLEQVDSNNTFRRTVDSNRLSCHRHWMFRRLEQAVTCYDVIPIYFVYEAALHRRLS